MNRKTMTRERGRGRRALLLLAVAVGLIGSATRASAQGDAIDGARAALEKWVETRRIISQEKRDWELGREVLQDRIEVARREIEAVRAKIAENRDKIEKAEKLRAERVAERDGLVAGVAQVKDSILAFEGRVRTILKRIPVPLAERVHPFSQRLPEEGAEEIKLSVGERFATVIAFLNSVNKFNREISTEPQVMELGDGRKAEVTALYLGIGQGYYITADGKSAGIGTAEKDGWIWTAANEFADRIGQAIAIYKSEKTADFVPLPVRIR